MLQRSVLQCSIVVALTLLLPCAGRAHSERYPKRDTITVERDGLRVGLDYAVPAGELAQALRRIYDRDRSGSLDDKERAALGEHLAHEAIAFLHVELDGKEVKLAVRTTLGDMAGSDEDRLSVHVDLAAPVALTDGNHRLRVRDRHKDRRVTVPVSATLGKDLGWRARPAVFITVDETRDAIFELRVGKR